MTGGAAWTGPWFTRLTFSRIWTALASSDNFLHSDTTLIKERGGKKKRSTQMCLEFESAHLRRAITVLFHWPTHLLHPSDPLHTTFEGVKEASSMRRQSQFDGPGSASWIGRPSIECETCPSVFPLLGLILRSSIPQWAAAAERCEGGGIQVRKSHYLLHTTTQRLTLSSAKSWADFDLLSRPSPPTGGLAGHSEPTHVANGHEGLMFPSPWEPLRP